MKSEDVLKAWNEGRSLSFKDVETDGEDIYIRGRRWGITLDNGMKVVLYPTMRYKLSKPEELITYVEYNDWVISASEEELVRKEFEGSTEKPRVFEHNGWNYIVLPSYKAPENTRVYDREKVRTYTGYKYTKALNEAFLTTEKNRKEAEEIRRVFKWKAGEYLIKRFYYKKDVSKSLKASEKMQVYLKKVKEKEQELIRSPYVQVCEGYLVHSTRYGEMLYVNPYTMEGNTIEMEKVVSAMLRGTLPKEIRALSVEPIEGVLSRGVYGLDEMSLEPIPDPRVKNWLAFRRL